MRSFFRIEESDNDAEARRKIAGTLVLLDGSFSESLPLVFDFLGVTDPEHPPPDFEPDERQQRLQDFVHRFVQARSAGAPAVILVDDLHWVDPGSDAFVAQLVAAVQATRTFLLLDYRPEYGADWLRRSHVEQLALAQLGEDAIAELVRDLVGVDPSVADLPSRIYARTGGNAFFTEEVVQALVESGQLEGERGAYQLVTPVERIEVPDRVQAVLAARIDRLAERENQVLQAAAVIGRNFDAELLAAVAPLPEAELSEALETLDEAEMLRATALYPVAQYTFKHPLTHQVALESQLSDARAKRHGAVAAALLERHADKLDDNAALLAYHFEESGAAWHNRAGEWIGFDDVDECVRHLQRARELAKQAQNTEAPDVALSATYRLMNYSSNQGVDRDAFRGLLEESRRLAADSRDPEAFPRVLQNYGQSCVLVGEVSQGLDFFEEAEQLAESLPDPTLRLDLATFAGWALLSLGRLREGTERCEPVTASGCRGRSNFGGPVDGMAGCIGAWALYERGRIEHGRRTLETAKRRLEGERITALPKLGRDMTDCRLLAYEGALDRGLRMALDLVDTGHRTSNANAISVALSCVGEIELIAARPSEARSALEEAARVARDAQTMLNLEARTLLFLARAHLDQGSEGEALATAEEAVRVARRIGARHHEAGAHVVLADVLLATRGLDLLDEIENAHAQASKLIEQTGAGIVAPYFHLSRARLAELKSDAAARQRALDDAQTTLEQMGSRLRAEDLAGPRST